jgi:ABC-2 type transport system ATP-binding protein
MQLKIQNLTQDYGKGKPALNQLNLTINSGILGLLGANGAGKSSLMRILATISKPTHGQVIWNGQDIIKKPNCLRPVLGYLPQSFGVYNNLSASEFLLYLSSLKGLANKVAKSKVAELLTLLNLTEVAHKPLANYSGGMRQRVGIAQALLNDPKLLIVDEPTVGLDPEERARFRQLLADLAGERIIIFSTHIVSDINAIADSIAIMDKGLVLSHTHPETLLKQIASFVWTCVVTKSQLDALRQTECISELSRHVDGYHVRIVAKQCPLPGAYNVLPNLEDAFLFVTQRSNLASSQSECVV